MTLAVSCVVPVFLIASACHPLDCVLYQMFVAHGDNHSVNSAIVSSVNSTIARMIRETTQIASHKTYIMTMTMATWNMSILLYL